MGHDLFLLSHDEGCGGEVRYTYMNMNSSAENAYSNDQYV